MQAADDLVARQQPVDLELFQEALGLLQAYGYMEMALFRLRLERKLEDILKTTVPDELWARNAWEFAVASAKDALRIHAENEKEFFTVG